MIKKEHDQNISVSKVGRIIKKLIGKGTIKSVAFCSGKKESKRRLFNGHAQRWTHGMKAERLGELIQVDHMEVNLVNNKEVKHFQAICPITKLSVAQVYFRATSMSAANFLKLMISQFPFQVHSIQVDGGSEFMGDFEACKARKIKLFVLPPRSPECNGHVERCNGTMKYEFYRQYNGSTELSVLQQKLQKYGHLYNNIRPHQGLSYLTPQQYYDQIKNTTP